MARRKKRKGERRKGNRWEVFVRVNGELRSTTFPLDSTPEQRDAWKLAQKGQQAQAVPLGSLGRDCVRWLRTKKHTPDYPNKRTYIARWLKLLGAHTPRATITAADVETALAAMRQEIGPTTIRHHRTALIQVWAFCDGKRAYNPAAETTRPADAEPEVRAPKLAHVLKAIHAIPSRKTRARLMLILTTGLPHKQIMQLVETDWDRRAKRLRVTRRRKGKGARGRILPLSTAGMKAMQEFADAQAWGPFSPSTVYRYVKEACVKVKVPPFRPYDLRHIHGALLYRETGDLTTTARLLGHAGTKTAERYTMDAWAAVDAVAVAKVGQKLEQLLEMRKTRRKSAKVVSLRS